MPEPRARERFNLHGEFLGVTSMACYSAPWHLQGVLLVLVGYLFFHRVRARSQDNQDVLEHLGEEEPAEAFLEEGASCDPDDLECLGQEIEGATDEPHVLENFNRLFFGFTVAKKDLAAYWAGFSIYLITCAHVLVVTLRKLPKVWSAWTG